MNLFLKKSLMSLLLIALVFVVNSPNASAATQIKTWNDKLVLKNDVANSPTFTVVNGQSISFRFDLKQGPLTFGDPTIRVTFQIKNLTTGGILDTITLNRYYGQSYGAAYATREYTNLKPGTYVVIMTNSGTGNVYTNGAVYGS